jgi:hypothetical protein
VGEVSVKGGNVRFDEGESRCLQHVFSLSLPPSLTPSLSSSSLSLSPEGLVSKKLLGSTRR